jgi:hypothetical protein
MNRHSRTAPRVNHEGGAGKPKVCPARGLSTAVEQSGECVALGSSVADGPLAPLPADRHSADRSFEYLAVERFADEGNPHHPC